MTSRPLHALLLALSLLTTAGTGHGANDLEGRWVVGLHLGELPIHGSRKLGLHAGYHIDEHVYVGLAVQIPDRIARGSTSFNAAAIGLEGLRASRERVGPRAYLEARLRPHRYAPFLSTGFCLNGTDTETIDFDDRRRRIGATEYVGGLTVIERRAAGLRPAIGAGYAVTFDSGLALHTGWAGWWLRGAPTPEITIEGVALSPEDTRALIEPIERRFRASPFNTYHVFQAGRFARRSRPRHLRRRDGGTPPRARARRTPATGAPAPGRA